jgi:hypothetical protein
LLLITTSPGFDQYFLPRRHGGHGENLWFYIF